MVQASRVLTLLPELGVVMEESIQPHMITDEPTVGPVSGEMDVDEAEGVKKESHDEEMGGMEDILRSYPTWDDMIVEDWDAALLAALSPNPRQCENCPPAGQRL